MTLPYRGVRRLIRADRCALVLATLWGVAIAIDGVSTVLGMQSGASTEGNPAAAAVMDTVGLVPAVVGLSAWTAVLAIPSLARPQSTYEAAAVWTLRAVLLVKFVIGVSNVLLLAWGVVLPWTA